MTFGLTPQGFNAPRLADVKQALENAFIAELGDVNTDPQSVIGQLIGIFAKVYADVWENMNDVYLSQYPNSASGVSLDNVVQLNGISRLPATQTVVVATVDGLEGTLIPQGSLARIPSTNDTFFANTGGIISRTNADIVQIEVTAVTTQPYTVVLNNVAYTYSLPVVTFSNTGDIFQAGQSVTITVNGVTLPAVPYNTSSNQTLADVAAAIQGFASGSVCTAAATNPNIITITPLTGKNLVVNSIVPTGPGTHATNVVTFLAPANFNAITAALTAIINANDPPFVSTDNMDHTITINADLPQIPFNAQVGTSLSVIYQASPVTFLSENYGPVPAPPATLTQIVTPIAGWNSITNINAGALGRLVETDAQLRIRRQNSIKLLGAGTVEAIQAGIAQKVPGVISAIVFENTSLQQEPVLVVFPLPFTSGDVITVTYNTADNFVVNFLTDQDTTMALIVAGFEALPEVLSASFGGTGNQTVTVLMKNSEVLYVNSAEVVGVPQEAAIKGGRPPKSFEAVVQGGTDEAVAEQIWLTKPAGIETFGNVNNGNGIPIIDSQGDTQIIFFSRPTPIYIWVQVALTLYAEESFPTNGVVAEANNINNYINGLGVGVNVLFQRVLAQIFSVQGVASGNMQIAATNEPLDSPIYGTADITIEDNEIAISDLSRIVVTVV